MLSWSKRDGSAPRVAVAHRTVTTDGQALAQPLLCQSKDTTCVPGLCRSRCHAGNGCRSARTLPQRHNPHQHCKAQTLTQGSEAQAWLWHSSCSCHSASLSPTSRLGSHRSPRPTRSLCCVTTCHCCVLRALPWVPVPAEQGRRGREASSY